MSIFRCQASPDKPKAPPQTRKAPLLKTFWRRFWVEYWIWTICHGKLYSEANFRNTSKCSFQRQSYKRPLSPGLLDTLSNRASPFLFEQMASDYKRVAVKFCKWSAVAKKGQKHCPPYPVQKSNGTDIQPHLFRSIADLELDSTPLLHKYRRKNALPW